MNAFERLFERIALEAEVIDTATVRHRLLGMFNERHGRDELSPVGRRQGPPANLWRLIYLHYHAGDDDGVQLLKCPRSVPRSLGDLEDPAFAGVIDRANRGQGFYEPGWQVTGVDGDALAVRRSGLTLRADRSAVRGPRIDPGSTVEVAFPKALRYAYAGCYLAIGDAGFCRREDGPVVRLYFALENAVGAATVMRELTTLLNRVPVPFQVKVMNDPARLRRRDSLVLYLYATHWSELRGDFETLSRRCARSLRDEAPCFALPLARGWSYAEEPAVDIGVLSFGEHRSMLAANGLFAAYEHGEQSPQARLRWITRCYQEAGLDIAHPYLGPR